MTAQARLRVRTAAQSRIRCAADIVEVAEDTVPAEPLPRFVVAHGCSVPRLETVL